MQLERSLSSIEAAEVHKLQRAAGRCDAVEGNSELAWKRTGGTGLVRLQLCSACSQRNPERLTSVIRCNRMCADPSADCCRTADSYGGA
ncbi:hypothetical protein [Paenibacillus mendelii]|uniref:Uncharacterized protein n=1 Tax=Paenibacillus mendelii TaxID=206163 RepID=A0ABV6JCB5_9BACL|nr:hypothetical protein [Paenibacillus mendelii]MCQ6562686.1 hypothetical protein [Paenibacillus mendelii]